MPRAWPAVLSWALLTGGCGGEARTTGAPGSPAVAAAGERDKNACHLLSHAEVSALTERRVTMRDQTEASARFSTCEYSDSAGQFAFELTAYWEGGRQEWDTWQLASGLAKGMFAAQEGVNTDSLVRQGPVGGLGDAAYFSELLPSLVLKGDLLLEMKLNYVPEADTKFRALAGMLLSRI